MKRNIILTFLCLITFLYFAFEKYIALNLMRKQFAETEKFYNSVNKIVSSKKEIQNKYNAIIEIASRNEALNDKNNILKKISAEARLKNIKIESINSGDELNITMESPYYNACSFIDSIERNNLKISDFSIVLDKNNENHITGKVRCNMTIKPGPPDKLKFSESLPPIIKNPFGFITKAIEPDERINIIYKGSMTTEEGGELAVLQRTSDSRIIYAAAGDKIDNIIIRKIFFDKLEITQNGKTLNIFVK